MKKIQSVRMDKYFEVVNPSYTIYRIIPNTGIRNFYAIKVASVINQCYRDLMKRCHKEDKKYFYCKPAKVAYMMVYEKGSIDFFFIVPDFRKHLIKEKISSSWKNITIEEVDQLPSFSSSAIRYSMEYSKEDALSLKVNKADNDLLTSTLNVVDLLEEGERVGVLYNFIPQGGYQQKGFRTNAQETLKNFKNNKPVDKRKGSSSYIGLLLLRFLLTTADNVIETLGNFLGGKQEVPNMTESFFRMVNQKELHDTSKNKVNKEIVGVQIDVISDSYDSNRAEVNALSLTESFKVIKEDNNLVPRRNNRPLDPFKYKTGDNIDLMSTDEIGANLIALPGKSLIEQYKIDAIKVTEVPLPQELQEGYISTGKVTHRGVTKESHMSNHKNMPNLGLTVLGPQGAGKTTYFKRYVECAIQAGEGVIIPDFIKNCELAEDIKEITPKDKLIEIDLSDPKMLQGLGFNEIKVTDNMTDFEILENANLQTQQTVALINAINDSGDPLSPRMRRYLTSACMICYIHENQSLKRVVNILEEYDIRDKYINMIPKALEEQLEDEIRALKELNEINKDGSISTRGAKIENILDRINLLREDIRLKYMFNKSTEGNIDFVEAMNQGKVVLIKMPEHKFPTKYVKNVLVTFFISKIWIASQIRGSLFKNPPRVHCILDEIFQAPTAETILKDILLQARKFQLKFVFSCHYLNQLKIVESIKSSGSSFMLLKGADKKNFNELKEELYPYELDDLLHLKDYHSLNLLNSSQGYVSFISDLYDSKYDNKKGA